MGGGPDIPKAETMGSVLNAYTQYLPGLIQSTAAQQPGVAQAQLNSTLATQPLYNALNLQQAQQYAVPLAQVGQQVSDSNAQAGAQTNFNQLTGAGGASAVAAEQLARLTNPGYYQVQDASNNQATNLLNSYNMNGLSGGEQSAVERSLAQSNSSTGNLGVGNPLNTVSNAMNFGDAYHAKQNSLMGALGSANQTATSAQNTGFNPVNIALGQPNASTMGNFGTGTFSNTGANTQNSSAGNAFNFGSSMLGGMQGSNNAATQANSGMGGAPYGVQGLNNLLSGL